MGESHESLLRVVKHYQENLDKYTESRNELKLLHSLERLHRLPIKVAHLEQTGVGRTVNGLRKVGGDVGEAAKALVAKWKDMVVCEQEDEDVEEEDDDEEDGYQSGSDSEKTRHRKSSSKDRKRSRHHKDKHRHHRKNGHSKQKPSSDESSSSSEEEPKTKKMPKRDPSDDEDDNKHKAEVDSADDFYTPPEKKIKSDSDDKKRRSKEETTSSKSKNHHSSDRRDKHHKSRSKEQGKKEKLKEDNRKKEKKSHKSKDDNKKVAKKSGSSSSLTISGIDSGSGASFAEALGMCEPSSSKGAHKKKSLPLPEKREKLPTTTTTTTTINKTEEAVPKMLKDTNLEPLDLNISSLLPTITPHYRPLTNLANPEQHGKKVLSDYEKLSNIISSKNQRTKVYSGNKMGCGKVSSLFDICIRILQDNIDALEYTGGVPYSVLKPILEKANPNQLFVLEHHNPYLIEDTDELWQFHCQKDFRNKHRQELESWREMYMRCLDEREAKLKALTANIKQSQDKSLPVRTTKLAYVDDVAKPPRNIARRQMKNGTTGFDKKPMLTPSARLSSLATAGEAGKVAVPNPGARAMERSSGGGQVMKVKKAPLMAKSLSLLKNRFRR